VTKFDEVFLG